MVPRQLLRFSWWSALCGPAALVLCAHVTPAPQVPPTPAAPSLPAPCLPSDAAAVLLFDSATHPSHDPAHPAARVFLSANRTRAELIHQRAGRCRVQRLPADAHAAPLAHTWQRADTTHPALLHTRLVHPDERLRWQVAVHARTGHATVHRVAATPHPHELPLGVTRITAHRARPVWLPTTSTDDARERTTR